jgi:hypothetical protein
MTEDQLSTILSKIHAGATLSEALATTGISQVDYDEAIATDDEIEDVINDELEQQRMGRVHESTHDVARDPVRLAHTAAASVSFPTPSRETVKESHQAEITTLRVSTAVVGNSDPKMNDGGSDLNRCPIDKDDVTREANALAPGPFGFLLWTDEKVTARGLPPMSSWWRQSLGLFYASGKRWGIFRVGRGGGKSTTLVRVAGSEAVFAERQIPPGQRWMWPFLSVEQADASRRVLELQIVLRCMGIATEIKKVSNRLTIELNDINGQLIEFISIAATIAGVSGPTTIGTTIDEEAKLRDKVKNVNPSTEILISLMQTFRAREGVRAIRCSSAWTDGGSHAQSIDEGDTDSNFIARIGEDFIEVARDGLLEVELFERAHKRIENADKIRDYRLQLNDSSPNIPTWVANPTISALNSWREVRGISQTSLGSIKQADYWLRENASLPLRVDGPSMNVNQIQAFADMNQRLIDKDQRRGLATFDGLQPGDPRRRQPNFGNGGGTL